MSQVLYGVCVIQNWWCTCILIELHMAFPFLRLDCYESSRKFAIVYIIKEHNMWRFHPCSPIWSMKIKCYKISWRLQNLQWYKIYKFHDVREVISSNSWNNLEFLPRAKTWTLHKIILRNNEWVKRLIEIYKEPNNLLLRHQSLLMYDVPLATILIVRVQSFSCIILT